MKLLPYGPQAVLAEFESLSEVMAHSGAWRAAELAGVVEIVPAARTVLVVHDGSLAPDALQVLTTIRAPSRDAAACGSALPSGSRTRRRCAAGTTDSTARACVPCRLPADVGR